MASPVPFCHGPAHRTRAPRRGFTLVELLVVIAIITVLASLVLTASSRALDSARRAQCAGNLAQIGKAFWMYAHGNREVILAIGAPAGGYAWWYDALDAYTRNPKVFTCPAKPQTRIGYGCNVRWADPIGDLHCWNGVLPTETLKHPSGTIAFCDAGNVTNYTAPPQDWKEDDALPTDGKVRFPYHDADPFWAAKCPRPVPRHRGLCNCLMFDGSVGPHRPEDLLRHKYGEAGCLFDNQ